MDEATKAKIGAILERVEEPQSFMSVAELGLVSRVSLGEEEKLLVVSMNIGMPRFQCPACSAINGEVKRGIERRLREEFERDFPGYRIEFD